MAKKLNSRADGRGGQRANAGRPQKLDKELWGKVTCILRHDTIARLREGADSRFFGDFLQDHLDRYPLPSREQYLTLQRRDIPLPKPKVVAPWNDKRLSVEERAKHWFAHERERMDKLAAGLSEDQRQAHSNDQPGKVNSRKSLAHQKR